RRILLLASLHRPHAGDHLGTIACACAALCRLADFSKPRPAHSDGGCIANGSFVGRATLAPAIAAAAHRAMDLLTPDANGEPATGSRSAGAGSLTCAASWMPWTIHGRPSTASQPITMGPGATMT